MSKQENMSKLIWYMKGPFRGLRRARDFYVETMNGCASKWHYGGVVSGYIVSIPRSHTFPPPRMRTGDDNDDFHELARSSVNDHRQIGVVESKTAERCKNKVLLPRSRTVACERIDEDKVVGFDERDEDLYLRSRNYDFAAPDRNRAGGGGGLNC